MYFQYVILDFILICHIFNSHKKKSMPNCFWACKTRSVLSTGNQAAREQAASQGQGGPQHHAAPTRAQAHHPNEESGAGSEMWPGTAKGSVNTTPAPAKGQVRGQARKPSQKVGVRKVQVWEQAGKGWGPELKCVFWEKAGRPQRGSSQFFFPSALSQHCAPRPRGCTTTGPAESTVSQALGQGEAALRALTST